jgi:Holin of 3TMs, for gene-transfer release
MLDGVLGLAGTLIDRLIPDQGARDQARLQLLEMAQRGDLQRIAAQAAIIRTEAGSGHWLAANWRPLCMLTFAALIVARWMGWSAPGMTEAEALKLWNIVELGLGGYVIGRSAEKIVPSLLGTVMAGAAGRGRGPSGE